MNLKNIITLFSVALIIVSCAQIVPLTGGEIDIAPPEELESSPINGAVNFTDKIIIVEFDEFIKLTNLSQQLIVSPIMENSPEITIKGKKLVIKLKDELAPNTTYSLNFGNAISDITENNIFPNYKYVFSTGTFIDSLSYSGTVINAFDLSVKENIYVLFYDQFEDSVPLKELPRYVALSDNEGKYSITNIANGKYKLFAINDINGNYLFDLPNEEVGFKSEIISLDSSYTDNQIYLFEEEKDLQYIVKSEHKSYGKIDIILNRPTENLTLTPLNKTFNEELENWSVIEKNNTGDSLTIWLWPNAFDEDVELLLKDGNEIIDTLEFEIIPKTDFKDTTLLVSTNITNPIDLNKNILININRPFAKYLPDSIKLYEDSVLITATFFTDIDLRKFELAYDFKERTNYQLIIPPGTFEDIYGLKNDTVKVNFKSRKTADYGIINLTIIPDFLENYIVQLYKNKKLIEENYLGGKLVKQYKFLSPGAYSLKLIVDVNGDQKWNTGDYLKGLQPEKVILYDKEIKIRANWDNDIIWTVKE